jgi:hypothetical protein
MPDHIKLVARYGNALAALVFGLLGLGLLTRQPGASLFLFLVCALAVFNLYVIEHCNRLLSEEEWLKSEVRKAELRQKLSELEHNNGHSSSAEARQDA